MPPLLMSASTCSDRSIALAFSACQRSTPRTGPQHLGGQTRLLGVDVVPERRARHCLPARLPRQIDDPVAQPVQLEPRAEREVDLRSRRDVQLGRRRDLDELERRHERLEVRDALRELRRNADVGERRRPRSRRLELGRAEQRGQRLGERRRAGRVAGNRRRDVDRPAAVAQEPARRALEQDARPEQHRDLRLGRHAPVERLDLRPEAAQPEHLARHRVGARDVVGAGAGLVAEAEGEGRPGAVDEVVDDPRRDDLPPQRVPLELRPELLAAAAPGSSARARSARYGSSGRSEASSSWASAIFVCESRVANSGAVSPPPAAWRSSKPSSVGRNSSSRFSVPACSRLRT